MFEKVSEAVEFIKSKIKSKPKAAIVLGSGLGSLVSMLEDAVSISTADIPHYPRSTAPSHKGEIVFGKLEGVDVAILRGRVHFYEGYSMKTVTFPVRVLAMLGVKNYFATNAAGGISSFLAPGDLVLVYDHINFMGTNPLMGENEPRWNVRFPDMTTAYRNEFSDLVARAAAEAGVMLHRGVYMAFTGPSYETPAEIRAARVLGADIVGMSTVPEVIVANAMGMNVAVVSCVSNFAAGITMERLTEEEVLNAGLLVKDSLSKIIYQTVRGLRDV